MGLEQWGASEQYYKIVSVYPEYEGKGFISCGHG